jgi:hypothetical protein
MAAHFPTITTNVKTWHGVPYPTPEGKSVPRVVCDRGDGTLNIHTEETTCEVCAPTVREDFPGDE